MKKYSQKWLLAILLALFVLFVFSLSACDGECIHQVDSWKTVVEPTCTLEGTSEGACTKCGETQQKVIPANGHVVGDWAVDKQATCTETGSRHKECTVCQQTIETETIPATHAFGDWHEAIPATCTADGLAGYKTCSVCNKNFDENGNELQTLVLTATGHNYVDNVCTLCGDEIVSHGLAYTLSTDGTYAVSGLGTCTDAVVSIPSKHENVLVTSIADMAFSNSLGVTSIFVPASVKTIGKSAFYGCTKLATVIFGSNSQLTSIGAQAFYQCRSLDGIQLPSGVERLVSKVFYGCESLTSIAIPSSAVSVAGSAFFGCTKLASVTFAQGCKVTRIGDNAFAGTGLASFVIPKSVTTIGRGIFADCTKIQSVQFEDAENWFITRDDPETTGNFNGTATDVTDASQNAKQLKKNAFYWYKTTK